MIFLKIKDKKMKFMTPEEQSKIFICLRYLIYFILTACFAFSLRLISSVYKEKTFMEYGIIENLQLVILILTILSFMVQSVFCKQHRSLLLFLASLCCFASIRELDSYFEKIIPFISWKFSYLFPLSSISYLIYDKIRAKKSLFLFISTPAFSLMCTAMFIFITIAQIIGNKTFISYIIPTSEYIVLIRRFIEESVEVVAYFILFLSSVEFFISMKQSAK